MEPPSPPGEGPAGRRALQVLLLEGDPRDAERTEARLREAGLACRVERAGTEGEFRAALERRPPDLILADHLLPGFDGPAALRLARAACPDVPFLFVSGPVGEERAIESLRAGAAD